MVAGGVGAGVLPIDIHDEPRHEAPRVAAEEGVDIDVLEGVAALAGVGVLAVVVACEVLGAGFALHDAVEHAGTVPEHDGEGEVLLLEVVGM